MFRSPFSHRLAVENALQRVPTPGRALAHAEAGTRTEMEAPPSDRILPMVPLVGVPETIRHGMAP
jgi:hypothetical protein